MTLSDYYQLHHSLYGPLQIYFICKAVSFRSLKSNTKLVSQDYILFKLR